jgi:virginiamycin B lyase
MIRRSIGALAMIPALLLTACTHAPKAPGQRPSPNPAASAVPAHHAGDVVADVEVPGAPTFLGTGFGSLWIAVAQDNGGVLARMDPVTNRILATIAVGGFPVGIAAGFGSMWQANNQDNTLSRIDPATNKVVATIAVGSGPAQVVVAGGLVWVGDQDSTLTAVDPASNRRARTVHVGRGNQFRALATGAGSIWTDNNGGGISRLDAATGTVLATIPISACCDGDLVFDHGLLWVSNPGHEQVYRVDTRTNRVVGHFRVPQTPRGITIAGGRLWITHGDASVLSWHDVNSGRQLGSQVLSGFLGGMAVTDATTIWVQTLDEGSVKRLAVG